MITLHFHLQPQVKYELFHIYFAYPKLVGPAFASPGQTIATLLGATCCVRLVTLLRRIATCCELKIELMRMPRRNIVARTWPNDCNTMQYPKMLHETFDYFQIWASKTQHVPTSRNRVAERTQHVALNMLHSTITMRYVKPKCCDRLAGA